MSKILTEKEIESLILCIKFVRPLLDTAADKNRADQMIIDLEQADQVILKGKKSGEENSEKRSTA